MTEEKPSSSAAQRKSWLLLLGAALLMVQFVVRADDSLQRKSPVWDETLHMDYGANFLKRGPTFDAQDHPYPFAAILALPMAGFGSPELDASGNIAIAHPDNLWPVRQMNLAVAALGLVLMAWLVMGLFGQWVAMAFLIFGTLDPGWIAQARFATTDIAHGLGFALVPLLLFRFGPSPTRRQLIITGCATTLALMAKFSGLLLFPLICLLFFLRSDERRRTQRIREALRLSALVTISALIILLLIFEIHAVLGQCSFADGPRQLWSGFQSFLEMRGLEHGSFFMGSYDEDGALLYFPALFLSKTPLLLLGLILGGFFFATQRTRLKKHRLLFLIPAIYLLISILSGVNSGYRHMTPVLPFLWLLAAWTLCDLATRLPFGRLFGAAMPLLLFLEVASAHPHYLPFTNQLWGGQDTARTIAVDAATDWGQDLTTLAGYLHQNPPRGVVHLAYFGRTDPAVLGIQSICRPCGALGFRCENNRPHAGCHEGAETLAISATCLEGAARRPGNQAGRDDCYSWLRDREPDAVLGGSILIFKNVEGHKP